MRLLASWLSWSLALACCLAAEPGRPIERVYIEAFATKAGAKQLQQDVAAEIRKLSSIVIVADQARADAILGGGGEIWIKGYRSLNPRSGRLPSNGSPVYGGFLSVELKEKSGVTLWSYLATPAPESLDVSKDLARRIAKHLTEALPQLQTQVATPPPPAPSAVLNGAGATFPYPVYAKWFANYTRENPSVQIRYDPIGSESGVRKVLDGEVDFGASDSPEVIHELAPNRESGYLLLPSVVGAVVPIVNLPGVSGDISFTPEALAGIFLGKIKKWNDPVLTQANRGLRLPDLDIIVVHRADGSGTSHAFTSYLSKSNPEWKNEIGASLAPRWPTGRAAAGNDGVAKLVKELGGSIGYVEFIYGLQNHLSYGSVRNRNGEFVSASLESIGSAVSRISEFGEDFRVSLADPPGSGVYPISSFTWLVVPTHIDDDAKRNSLCAFLKWMLGPGQRQAAALGYLALPPDLVAREQNAIARIH